MTYVPIVTPTTVPPPSPRTRELAGLLTQVLEEYTKAHPATTSAEIRAAVKMAEAAAGSDRGRVVALVSLGVGLMALGLTAALFFFRAAGEGDADFSLRLILIALITFLGFGVIIAKMKSG